MSKRLTASLSLLVLGIAALAAPPLAAQAPMATPAPPAQAAGEAALQSGALSEASQHFERARAEAGARKDPRAEAAALDGLGLVASARGRRLTAERLHQEAAGKFRAAGDARGESRALFNHALAAMGAARGLSWLDVARGLPPERGRDPALAALAADRFERAGAAAEAAGDTPLAVQAFVAAAQARAASNAPAGAGRLALRALAAAEGLPDGEGRALALIAATEAALRARLFDAAGAATVLPRAMSASLAAADALDDPEIRALARGHAARAYGIAGRRAEAEALSEQAAHLAAVAGAREARALWLGQAAAFAEADRRDDRARALYRAATEAIAGRRDALAPPEVTAGQFGLRAEGAALLAARADFLLARASAEGAARRDGEAYEAREVIELARAIEIEGYVGDPCVRRGISAELADLPPGVVVLYPIKSRDRIDVLVGGRDGVFLRRSAVSGAALEAAAERLRRSLSPETLSDAWAADARLLYDAVIAPVRAELAQAGVETLLYAPEGVLRGVPLAAFQSPEQRFVAQDFSVATVLSLSLLDPTPTPDRPYLALVGGVSDAVEGFSALPAVPGELEAVARSVPSRRLLNEGFNRDALEANLSGDRLNIVHVATHGVFGGGAKESFLLGHDGAIYLDELSRIAARARVRDAAIDLLTLSACQTAAGDERAVMGLAGAAFASGAQTVVGSLWQVSDESTSKLFERFYAVLDTRQRQGRPRDKALALAEAQREAIAAGRHPFEWSGFVLIGKWR